MAPSNLFHDASHQSALWRRSPSKTVKAFSSPDEGDSSPGKETASGTEVGKSSHSSAQSAPSFLVSLSHTPSKTPEVKPLPPASSPSPSTPPTPLPAFSGSGIPGVNNSLPAFIESSSSSTILPIFSEETEVTRGEMITTVNGADFVGGDQESISRSNDKGKGPFEAQEVNEVNGASISFTNPGNSTVVAGIATGGAVIAILILIFIALAIASCIRTRRERRRAFGFPKSIRP